MVTVKQVEPAAAQEGRTGSLVLRAWLEQGTLHLRVRVVEIQPGLEERSIVATTSADEACQAVRSWLETLSKTSADGHGMEP